MRHVFRHFLLGLFAIALPATAAHAAPVVCSATLSIGQGPAKLFEASVNPAVSCTGPIVGNNVFPSSLVAFGHTWLAQDKDPGGDQTENNADESVLSIVGANTMGGTFTINPAGSQCGLLDCNVFVFGLKFGGVVVYWDLGNITAPTTFTWATNQNALSNGSAYARYEEFEISAPEPGLMLLLATGAAIGIRRRFSAAA